MSPAPLSRDAIPTVGGAEVEGSCYTGAVPLETFPPPRREPVARVPGQATAGAPESGPGHRRVASAVTDLDGWRSATVVSIQKETTRASTFRLDLGTPLGHRAGQHVKVRVPVTGATSRSYSVASAPARRRIFEITVERLDGGVVSGYLHDRVRRGDQVEVRGPRGSFTWEACRPALLVAGGSGVVPLMSMLRLSRATCQQGLVHLVASARTPADLIYRDELPGPETSVAYTRVPTSLGRDAGRLRADDLAPVLLPGATAYVCGPKDFVTHVRGLLDELGHDRGAVRTEAFGPTI